ncbi:MAG: glycyl-radical enzyme activating protein [Clostridia bacterium]|nr:glycyl-radical enzyme activating protein [Clostridia bacterium]
MQNSQIGTIFNIQRFSLHDGPGIRTTVFCKGCNLRCFWCHNPEGLVVKRQLMRYPDKCIGCGKCGEVCAHRLESAACIDCGACAAVCPAEARTMAGEEKTVDEVVATVLKDRAFYARKGGATFSGGEPLLQADFVRTCADRLNAEGIDCAIETAACVPWERFETVLPALKLVIMDLKHCDANAFAKFCGGKLATVTENLGRLARSGIPYWVRIPLIPDVNADAETVGRIGKLLAETVGEHLPELVELMPFHGLGESKYDALGQNYDAKSLSAPEKDLQEACREALRALGLNAI